jgi:hypothetical protein
MLALFCGIVNNFLYFHKENLITFPRLPSRLVSFLGILGEKAYVFTLKTGPKSIFLTKKRKKITLLGENIDFSLTYLFLGT